MRWAGGLVVALVAALVAAGPAQAAGPAAAFTRRSYRPGQTATLAVWGASPSVRVQLLHVGPETVPTRGDASLHGVPVGPVVALPARRGRVPGGPRLVSVPLFFWPSGLYAARVWVGGRLLFAPFVLDPDVRGRARVLVVLSTNTWGAYNLRDGLSWYANPAVRTVDLRRPFLQRGVPPHLRGYTLGFLHWLAHSGRQADFASDEDLDDVRGSATLRALYDLIVFAGHEEYVTRHMYDLVEGFRDRGGSLAFLSANNFFREVRRRGDRLTLVGRWRDLGRPEAALVGVQYVGWDEARFPNRPYVVADVAAAPWLFAGTGLHDGSRFGSFGIEVDARAPASPPGTRILAVSPDIFGPGESAEMSYYRTPAGAQVFAAGVMNFGGWAEYAPVSRMLANLWAQLTRPASPRAPGPSSPVPTRR